MTRIHVLGALATAAVTSAAAAQPVVFTQWKFNTPTNQINNNPAPSTGQGTAVPLGMTNNYAYATSPPRIGSLVMCDVTGAGASSDTGSAPNNCWRVRGSFDTTLGNAGIGWSIFAPQYTQGAEFDVSTVNYAGITFKFDWFTTNQGVRHMQVQYSADAGANWTDIGPIRTAATNGWVNNISIDLSAIPAVDDNPNVRVRLVSVYDPGTVGTPSGNPAFPIGPFYSGASGGIYNNNSGNWRFDAVTFTGTAIRSVGPAATGTVSPPAVCSSGGPLTFTVTTQSGAGPASTGMAVTADLSSIGLPNNQAFYDDATHGDAVAGDGVFSFAATVPSGNTLGGKTISATVTDAQARSGGTTIPVVVGDCSGNSTAKVVISQVFGGGGNLGAIPQENAPYHADFVELFNRSAQVVNIDGWSVQYSSPAAASGFDNPGDQVVLSGVIQPGQHLLIRMSDPVPGFNPLPTPDFAQLKNFGGMGNTGGRVALVRSATLLGTNYNDPSIEDFVGYGSAAASFEGAAPAPTPTPPNNKANIRKLDGAQDTNQSFNDFAIAAPTPRNRASGGFLTGYAAEDAVAVCSGSTVTFTVVVFAAAGSTGITVTADVSEIVGSAATASLYDNGTHGDPFTNDGIYTLTYTVPANAAQGLRLIPITVADAQGRSDVCYLGLGVAQCFSSNAKVVISQVYGGGGNDFSGYNGDYAEIFNRSGQAVDLTGWSLQSARVTDAGFDSRIVALAGVIQPGEYRLIITNQLSVTGAVLPTADFVPVQPFGMESGSGRVALVSSMNLLNADVTRADVVDHMGYGSDSPTFEGIGSAPTLSNIEVAIRKQGGCQDTNHNAIDFDVVLALALPHNSASPASTCPTPLACNLADIVGPAGIPPPDGHLGGEDFLSFMGAFAGGGMLADVVGPAGVPPPDGHLGGEDFLQFLAAFAGGC